MLVALLLVWEVVSEMGLEQRTAPHVSFSVEEGRKRTKNGVVEKSQSLAKFSLESIIPPRYFFQEEEENHLLRLSISDFSVSLGSQFNKIFIVPLFIFKSPQYANLAYFNAI